MTFNGARSEVIDRMWEVPRIPAEIRVGAFTYKLLTDRKQIKKVSKQQKLKNADWTAFSDHDELIICINPSYTESAQRRDVLHEVMHCCLRNAGAWPNLYAELVSRAKGRHGGFSVEEYQVSAITLPLLGVLRDNPKLMAWLLTGAL